MRKTMMLLAGICMMLGTINAQTISGVVGTHACRRASYCDGIPFTVNTGASGFANGRLRLATGVIQFLDGSGLGTASIVNTQAINGAPLRYSFVGAGYTGKLVLTYSRHTSGWVITGGNIKLTLGQAAATGTATTGGITSGVRAMMSDPGNYCYTNHYAIEWVQYEWYFGVRTWNDCLGEEVRFTPWFPFG